MENFFADFIRFFDSGGPLMYPLAFIAIWLYCIGFSLFFNLRTINSSCSNELNFKAKLDEIFKESEKTDGRLELKKNFDFLRLSIMPKISAKLKIMGILATVAPLLGLLGTVSGMTLAISTMNDANSSVSEGISRALITTQCGLTIAIPAMVLKLFCSKLRQKILIHISRVETKMILERFAK